MKYWVPFISREAWFQIWGISTNLNWRLNLAISDVTLLAEAIAGWHASGSTALLDAYSDACLRRVWRAEHFSWWMTSMLHRPPDADRFDLQLQQSQLRYVIQSEAAARALAENYVGLAGAAATGRP